MEKTVDINRVHRIMAVTAASAVALSGMLFSGSVHSAYAVNGEVDTTTGVVWGANQGEEGYGTYQFTITNGTVVEGFVISDGQFPVESDIYNQATTWHGLEDIDRQKLALSTWLILQVQEGKDLSPIIDAIGDVSQTDEGKEAFQSPPRLATDRDALTAAVAGVIKSISDDEFTADSLPESARESYETIIALAELTENDPNNTFRIRSSANTLKSDAYSPNDAELRAPVIAGVTIPEGDDPEPSVTSTEETDTDTEIRTPITVTPTTETTKTTTTEEPEEPQLRTSAGNNNRALIEDDLINSPSREIIITDTVIYTGLEPNQEYRLVGEVMLHGEDGEALSAGQTGETVWIPEASDGRVEVQIPVTELGNGTLTVFETLYDAEGNVVAEHSDITDQAQTFTVRMNQTPEDQSGSGNQTDLGNHDPVPTDSVRFEDGQSRPIREKPTPSPTENAPSPVQQTTQSPSPSTTPEQNPTEDQPRQTINNVPSGSSSSFGYTIFTR